MEQCKNNPNGLFKNELKPIKTKKHKTFTVFLFILLFLIIATLYSKNILNREITVIANGSNASILNLGKVGPIISPQLRKERVNLLFLGIAGEGNSASQLTDTILIINSSPKAENPIAISIPRDLLVKYPNQNYYTKINTLYQSGGIKTIESKIFEITGMEIDYYLVLDLKSVKTLIDKLGGIDIVIEKDIYDPKFPAEYNSFETFSLKKGNQHLNGETTLKYIRTRNDFEGDFGRIKRQQQVIGVLKEKILKLNFVWNFPKILGIWNTLQNNTDTNIGLTDIKYAWNLIKKININEIGFNTIAPPLIKSGTAILNQETASVLVPIHSINNYEEIQIFINKLIN
ncbi:MAG TPA: LCP family protein [Candidatus Portnoybacteria bacterium]|jgi:LCP family protein required for cell wall assembly|nr:LCP family protein [Candidatus Portnoybacteria bacterium]MDD5751977.1 LCP family protein [Candidatus Portnoybacteria bacterium]HPJ80113.1 LCP family protein [Candidatus Portnoybacteria bacterium]